MGCKTKFLNVASVVWYCLQIGAPVFLQHGGDICQTLDPMCTTSIEGIRQKELLSCNIELLGCKLCYRFKKKSEDAYGTIFKRDQKDCAAFYYTRYNAYIERTIKFLLWVVLRACPRLWSCWDNTIMRFNWKVYGFSASNMGHLCKPNNLLVIWIAKHH